MPNYKIELDQPNQMKGSLVEVPPVGVIENGSSVKAELTEEQASFLATAYGVTVKTDKGKEVKAASLSIDSEETELPAPTEETTTATTEEGGE